MRIFRKLFFLILSVLLWMQPMHAESQGSHASVYGSEVSWLYRCNRQADLTIALTFDDGPHPTLTPQILDILNQYQIKATFFMVGENAERYPELVTRIRDEGHEIGNHTYSHIQIKSADALQLEEEILHCESIIGGISDLRPKLFRPPEGSFHEELGQMCDALGYRVVLWSVDTRDWCRLPPKDITEKVLKDVRSGDIILMHDYIGSNSPTPTALKQILPRLIKRGYTFSTVSELLERGNRVNH